MICQKKRLRINPRRVSRSAGGGALFSRFLPVVGISQLGESAINISVAPWVKVEDFGPAQAELYQALLERFKARNISIPFPQHEVRMLGGPA